MKWLFKEVDQQNEMIVTVTKNNYDHEVNSLMTYLESYAQEKSDIIPLKTPDGIRLLKKDSIIAVDVDGRQLQLKTLKGNFYITERLYQFKERMNSTDIVQVSKQSLININHLNKLEASFSGNMLAILINDVKVMVSRRYLKNLEQKLGL